MEEVEGTEGLRDRVQVWVPLWPQSQQNLGCGCFPYSCAFEGSGLSRLVSLI